MLNDDSPSDQPFVIDESPEAALRRAILSRRTRVSKPTVLTLPYPPPQSARHLHPGTIIFFAAEAGSRLFERLREAARTGDFETLDCLADRIGVDLLRAFLGSEAEVPAREGDAERSKIGFDDVPSLGEFRYKHRQLAYGIFPILTWEVAEASILWTGGPLADDQFTFIEYVGTSNAPAPDTLVLKIPPRLSDVEQAVVSQIPDDLSELHLRGSHVAILPAVAVAVTARITPRVAPYVPRVTAYITKAAGAFAEQLGKRAADGLVFVATYLITRATGIPARVPGEQPELSDEEIDRLYQKVSATKRPELGLALSVDRLLDLRQELINRSTP